FLRITVSAPMVGPGTASARCTAPGSSEPKAASPPAARPECRRKLRRSSMPVPPVSLERTGLALPRMMSSPVLRLISMAASLLQRFIAIGAVEGLPIRTVGLVARPGFLLTGIVGPGIGRGRRQCGYRGRGHRGRADAAKEIPAVG